MVLINTSVICHYPYQYVKKELGFFWISATHLSGFGPAFRSRVGYPVMYFSFRTSISCILIIFSTCSKVFVQILTFARRL